MYYDNNVAFNKTIVVPTVTLDSWAKDNNVKAVDFLWLDMQGFELPMLKQANNVLPTVGAIYIELAFVEAFKDQPMYWEVRSWLEGEGFVIYAQDFDDSHAAKGSQIKVGEPYFGNAIFINRNIIK